MEVVVEVVVQHCRRLPVWLHQQWGVLLQVRQRVQMGARTA
jgi:hypothetical protein